MNGTFSYKSIDGKTVTVKGDYDFAGYAGKEMEIYKVNNEEELDQGIKEWVKTNSLVVLNCILDPMDVSSALKRFTEYLSKKVKKGD